MIQINIDGTIPADHNISQSEIDSLINESFKLLNLTSNVIIEILFVSNTEIQALNKQYRKIDKPTDVLSFPQTQFTANKINLLGSIVICGDMVREKEETLPDVIKHGLLHLLGYDHEIDDEKWDKVAQLINCNL